MIESPVTRADEVFGTRRAEVDGGDGPHGDDRAAGVALLVGAQHPPAVHGGHDCAGPDRLRAPARAVVGTLHDRLAGVDDVRARVGGAGVGVLADIDGVAGHEWWMQGGPTVLAPFEEDTGYFGRPDRTSPKPTATATDTTTTTKMMTNPSR
jgi:hypothetical protein